MGSRRHRPAPDLTGSTLVHVQDSLFVDSVTGMVLTRVGTPGSTGYERVSIGGRDVSVHRLVWETLHGPIPEGLTINHEDGVKANNRPDNLTLATQSDQVAHAYRIGLREGNGLTGKARGSRLTAEQLSALRSAPRGQVTRLADEFGVSRSYAYQVRARRRLVAAAY